MVHNFWISLVFSETSVLEVCCCVEASVQELDSKTFLFDKMCARSYTYGGHSSAIEEQKLKPWRNIGVCELHATFKLSSTDSSIDKTTHERVCDDWKGYFILGTKLFWRVWQTGGSVGGTVSICEAKQSPEANSTLAHLVPLG